jgi:LmbE family N-acetylglucosaminyl deacetylase
MSDDAGLDSDGPDAGGVERILVVTAHPDDVDFGAAGSVATWTDADITVSYCICTDGDAGGADTGIPRVEMPTVRREEQTKAAAVVGVTDLHWLGFPDGALEYSLELRKAISRVIRITKPDRVVCQSPDRLLTRIYASHPDHLAAGAATISAVYPDSRNAWSFPELFEHEGLAPHSVPEIWLMAREAPDRFVDTTDVIDRKVEALLCHRSQMSAPDRIPEMMRDWGRMVAERAGFGPDRTAEGFERIDTA